MCWFIMKKEVYMLCMSLKWMLVLTHITSVINFLRENDKNGVYTFLFLYLTLLVSILQWETNSLWYMSVSYLTLPGVRGCILRTLEKLFLIYFPFNNYYVLIILSCVEMLPFCVSQPRCMKGWNVILAINDAKPVTVNIIFKK